MTRPLLTFDDGPSESTGEILDVLQEFGIHAVFFVIGFRGQQRRDLLQRTAEEGHILGNHTWDHVRLTGFSDEDVLTKLKQTNKIITEITDSAPSFFRAPWLAIDARVLSLASSLGLGHVRVDVDSCDYSDRDEHDVDYVTRAILEAKAGQIVVLHDGTGDDRESPTNPPRPKTVEAVRRALPAFAEKWAPPGPRMP